MDREFADLGPALDGVRKGAEAHTRAQVEDASRVYWKQRERVERRKRSSLSGDADRDECIVNDTAPVTLSCVLAWTRDGEMGHARHCSEGSDK